MRVHRSPYRTLPAATAVRLPENSRRSGPPDTSRCMWARCRRPYCSHRWRRCCGTASSAIRNACPAWAGMNWKLACAPMKTNSARWPGWRRPAASPRSSAAARRAGRSGTATSAPKAQAGVAACATTRPRWNRARRTNRAAAPWVWPVKLAWPCSTGRSTARCTRSTSSTARDFELDRHTIRSARTRWRPLRRPPLRARVRLPQRRRVPLRGARLSRPVATVSHPPERAQRSTEATAPPP